MPPRPRSPKGRAGITRRPRVAGLAPVTQRRDPLSDGEQRRAPRDETARPAAFVDDPLAEPGDPTNSAPLTPPAEREPERADAEAEDTSDAPTDDPVAPDVEDRDERLDDSAPAENASTPPEPKPARPGRGRRATKDGTAERAEPATEAMPALHASSMDASSADTAVLDLRALRTGKPEPDGERDTAPETETGSEGAAKPARGRGIAAAKKVPVLIGTFVVLIAVAVTFGVLDARLHGTPTATNTALVDVAGTAEASGQLSDALEKVYSFDFARLDENEKAARDVITPEFAAEFDKLFAEVRQRAPEQQAVVSATVTLSAVKELTGDHAVLVAFVDQQATRAAPDAESRQLAAAGRLTVTGEKVDGHWKIASVVPR